MRYLKVTGPNIEINYVIPTERDEYFDLGLFIHEKIEETYYLFPTRAEYRAEVQHTPSWDVIYPSVRQVA